MVDAGQVKKTFAFPRQLTKQLEERATAEERDMREIVIDALEVYLSVEPKDVEAFTVERNPELYPGASSRARAPLIDFSATLQWWLRAGRDALLKGKPAREKGGSR